MRTLICSHVTFLSQQMWFNKKLLGVGTFGTRSPSTVKHGRLESIFYSFNAQVKVLRKTFRVSWNKGGKYIFVQFFVVLWSFWAEVCWFRVWPKQQNFPERHIAAAKPFRQFSHAMQVFLRSKTVKTINFQRKEYWFKLCIATTKFRAGFTTES